MSDIDKQLKALAETSVLRPRGTGLSDIFKKDSDASNKFVGQRYTNAKSDLLEITHDKLENILNKHYEKRLLRTAWFNPLSIGIGLALTLATAEFKAITFGIEAPVWKAIFIILLIGSIGWFFYLIVKLARCWNETDIDHLINQIKGKN